MVALRTPVAFVAVLILPVARALPVKPSGASADRSAQPRAEGGDQATFLASIALPDNAVEVSSVSPAAEGARDEVQREVNAVNEALQSLGSSLQFDPDLLASKVRAGYGPEDALQDSEAAVTEAAQAEIGRAFRIAFKPIFKEVSDSAELRAFIDTEILQHKDDAIDQVKTTAVPMAIMAAVPLSVLVAAVLVLVYRAGYDQGQNSHVVRRLEQFLASHEGEGAEREPEKAPGGPVAERGSAARGFFPASGSVDLRPSLASIRDSLAAPAPPPANSWRWSQSVLQLWGGTGGGATALAPPPPRATLI